jgi:hypothetical protein
MFLSTTCPVSPPNLKTLDVNLYAVMHTSALALHYFSKPANRRATRAHKSLKALAITGSMSSFMAAGSPGGGSAPVYTSSKVSRSSLPLACDRYLTLPCWSLLLDRCVGGSPRSRQRPEGSDRRRGRPSCVDLPVLCPDRSSHLNFLSSLAQLEFPLTLRLHAIQNLLPEGFQPDSRLGASSLSASIPSSLPL